MNTLLIIKDGQVVNYNIENIFDSDKYTDFIGVTFSASPSFINDIISKFNEVDIVVGIPNNHVKDKVQKITDNIVDRIARERKGESIELYSKLNTESKDMIDKDYLRMWVSNIYSIHSKFYLMWNDDTDETRLILGSANLSYQAFDEKSNQFENIIIYDNDDLFDVFKDYYNNDLKDVLTSYFPKELKKINTREINKITDDEIVNVDKVFILSNSDIEKISTKAQNAVLDDVEEKVALGIIDKNVYIKMRESSTDKLDFERETKENEENIKIAYEIVKESITHSKDNPKLRQTQTRQKKIKTKMKKVEVKLIDNSLERELLVSRPDFRDTLNGKSGLFEKSSISKTELIPVGKKLSDDEIKTYLENLHRYMATFENYTYDYTDDYGQRIMESILYAFTTPFLSELRLKITNEESRLDIPQYLFIGGTGGSGKSSLLKVISSMIGIDKKKPWIWETLSSGAYAKKGRVETVDAWMTEENVNPILVDEISEDFFSNVNYGRNLIVNTSNRSAASTSVYPAFIGTTNTAGYSLPEEARRRSYYLVVDKKLRPKDKKESGAVYIDVIKELDNKLFLDFIVRMSEKLETTTDEDWSFDSNKSYEIDFLRETRNIFIEYYKLANIPLPRYFPVDKYNDDLESNQEKWRKLYLGNKDDFIYNKNTDTLFFRITSLDSGSGFGKKTSTIYAEALPQYIAVGQVRGVTDIELKTKEFFEWIMVPNIYEKKAGILSKIFGSNT